MRQRQRDPWWASPLVSLALLVAVLAVVVLWRLNAARHEPGDQPAVPLPLPLPNVERSIPPTGPAIVLYPQGKPSAPEH